MASVVPLASDEKETAEFGCRWMPKGAHSQRLHGLMFCTECSCLFSLYRREHYIHEEFFAGVTGRGSRFPGHATMQFASVVN